MNQHTARAVLDRVETVARRRYPLAIQAFAAFHGAAPRLAAPQRFSEKILWRKIFDRNPRFPVLQDKLAAKAFVAACLPALAQAEVLWQGTRAEDIPFRRFPRPYIVKCNHGCGFNIAVPAPREANPQVIVEKMRWFLSTQYGTETNERAYWPIPRRVFVEPLLRGTHGLPPDDYRLTVIAGRVAYIIADTRPGGRPATDYRDRAWNPIAATLRGTARNPSLKRPRSLDRMIAAAEHLAAGLDMLRVDFYEIDGEPVFGEFTVYPLSGHVAFDPQSFDHTLGALWDIRASHRLGQPRSFPTRLYRAALDEIAVPVATAPPVRSADLMPAAATA